MTRFLSLSSASERRAFKPHEKMIAVTEERPRVNDALDTWWATHACTTARSCLTRMRTMNVNLVMYVYYTNSACLKEPKSSVRVADAATACPGALPTSCFLALKHPQYNKQHSPSMV
jgi:hypothetical protein